ncbi:helix-turn-helix domain-containing protein [Pseudomonas sp. MAFF 730085]|uniref:Helix-turn-helix domain-containing protein n=1 Tax=Pseudomonas kitaguniensis TaxID=2607908 RepID=A0A5N7JNU4_9PSED|nr:helix-turn-helix domain-containing protein [Pseudomonas kitaguniensis]MPQ82991.1 helix-turn-helix domain-containing protein [Pseudomonas kitaguniensis]
MRIAIIALEGSLMSAITGLADLFWMTNQALRSPPAGLPPALNSRVCNEFETIIVSADGKALRDSQGRLIPVDAAFDDVGSCDAVLVTGMGLGPDRLPPTSESLTRAARWINVNHQQGALVGAACAGTFVLGEAGLLNNRRCTTTWWLHHVFKQRFPKALPAWGSAVEVQDRVVTTGGPLSWVDLALYVIRVFAGSDVAKLTADISVTDSLPLPQSVYAPRGFINNADPLLLETEQIIRHGKPGLTAVELAKALNVSQRTLHRRFRSLTNESPKELITRIRIETACVLLQVPGASVKQVALNCGYSEETSFRRAFIQLTGMTPADYKRWSKGRAFVDVEAGTIEK